MTTTQKVERIKAMQERLTDELRAIQDACPHTNKQGKYGGNTGNWCPQDDCYWIDVTCLDCQKRYTVYDNEQGYKQFNGKVVR